MQIHNTPAIGTRCDVNRNVVVKKRLPSHPIKSCAHLSGLANDCDYLRLIHSDGALLSSISGRWADGQPVLFFADIRASPVAYTLCRRHDEPLPVVLCSHVTSQRHAAPVGRRPLPRNPTAHTFNVLIIN